MPHINWKKNLKSRIVAMMLSLVLHYLSHLKVGWRWLKLWQLHRSLQIRIDWKQMTLRMLCHQLVHEHQSYHGFDHWYRCHSKATKTHEWDFFFHFVQTYHFNFRKTWDRVTFKNTSITLYNIYCHLKGNQITILKDLGNHKKLGEPLRKYTAVTWFGG